MSAVALAKAELPDTLSRCRSFAHAAQPFSSDRGNETDGAKEQLVKLDREIYDQA
jgi:hypothetical protein